MMVATQKPKVEYKLVEVIRWDGWKKTFIDLTIDGLKEPEIEIDFGQLGVSRMVGLSPQPIGEHFSVVWDGDRTQPRLMFDGWTDGTVQVTLEVTGR